MGRTPQAFIRQQQVEAPRKTHGSLQTLITTDGHEPLVQAKRPRSNTEIEKNKFKNEKSHQPCGLFWSVDVAAAYPIVQETKSTTRGIPWRSPIQVLTLPDWA